MGCAIFRGLVNGDKEGGFQGGTDAYGWVAILGSTVHPSRGASVHGAEESKNRAKYELAAEHDEGPEKAMAEIREGQEFSVSEEDKNEENEEDEDQDTVEQVV